MESKVKIRPSDKELYKQSYFAYLWQFTVDICGVMMLRKTDILEALETMWGVLLVLVAFLTFPISFPLFAGIRMCLTRKRLRKRWGHDHLIDELHK